MNRSISEIGGEILAVSQFTLLGDCRRGRRPSFDPAAPPDIARMMYERFVNEIDALGVTVATGVFQAMMNVEANQSRAGYFYPGQPETVLSRLLR